MDKLALMISKKAKVTVIRLYKKDWHWYAETPRGHYSVSELLKNA